MKAPPFVLTKVDGTYADVLAELHRESFAEGWSAASFQTTLETPGSFGYIAARTEDQDPLGFGVFRVCCEEGGGGEGEVLCIATRPSVRGSGIAKALMHTALREARGLGIETFFLEVAVDNAQAIGLYQSLGFLETGRRPGYYAGENGHRVDALIMALMLV
jgi:ribosomal-protein-alanine N-acetyltransferase